MVNIIIKGNERLFARARTVEVKGSTSLFGKTFGHTIKEPFPRAQIWDRKNKCWRFQWREMLFSPGHGVWTELKEIETKRNQALEILSKTGSVKENLWFR